MWKLKIPEDENEILFRDRNNEPVRVGDYVYHPDEGHWALNKGGGLHKWLLVAGVGVDQPSHVALVDKDGEVLSEKITNTDEEKNKIYWVFRDSSMRTAEFKRPEGDGGGAAMVRKLLPHVADASGVIEV
jgi:hypothetical protein